jgi:diguanylate cyclase (GGDEF)-like protein/PAS domain S-box-containing protein
MATIGDPVPPQRRPERGRLESIGTVLDTVALAAARLLRTASWEQCIEDILALMGDATSVDRVLLFSNRELEAGDTSTNLLYGWSADGIERHAGNGEMTIGRAFIEWRSTLERGEVICTVAGDRSPVGRALDLMNVVSIAVVPILVNRRLWGFLRFDDCAAERAFSTPDVSGMEAIARVLAAAIERQTSERLREETGTRYRSLVEQIPAVTYVDAYPDDNPDVPTPLYISPQVEGLLGYAVAEWMADPTLWERVVHPEDLERVNAEAWRSTKERVPYNTEYRMIHRDGRVVWIREHASVRRDEPNRREIRQGFWFDITTRRLAEEQLIAAELKHRALIEQIPAIVYLAEFGSQGEWLYVSPQIEEMLGYTAEEWTQHPEPFSRHVHPDHLARVLTEEEASWSTGEPLSSEYRIHARDGRLRWFHDQATLVKTESGEPLFWQGLIHDITDQKVAEERIAFLAYHDELTGMPNRAMFEELLNPALERARRHDLAVAVLSLDLDGFKLVNDSLGREQGDELLRQVAERLVEASRETDLVSRLGGDEFQLLLADLEHDYPDEVGLDHAQARAETVAGRIQAAFLEPFPLGDSEVYVSASIGISIYPFHAADGRALLKNAETAMYQSKRAGPGGHVVYSEETTDALTLLSLSTRLRKAAEQRAWTLHYQPVVDLASGALIGVEALIRWLDRENGLVYPGEFIPLAEQMGLIRDIGDWVIEAVCRQSRSWADAGLPIEVSFNVSTQQLVEPQFVDKLLGGLERAEVDAGSVFIEITESAAMRDPLLVHRVSEDLRAKGVRLAIDDFGTGYSSLSRLRDLPVSILKIDRSFVQDVPHDRHGGEMVKSIIQLARGLGMTPLAEGVETDEQRRFLLDNGCREGQGFLFSRPVPPAEIEKRLRVVAPVASTG